MDLGVRPPAVFSDVDHEYGTIVVDDLNVSGMVKTRHWLVSSPTRVQ
ncbi:MAG: hypothetical protein ABIQ18_21990 [Umezawaea sp.]